MAALALALALGPPLAIIRGSPPSSPPGGATRVERLAEQSLRQRAQHLIAHAKEIRYGR